MRFATLGLILLTAFGTRADRPPDMATADSETKPFSVLHSTTRRFVAGGPSSALNLQALLFAEEVADRLENRLGHPLPSQPGNPLRFRFHVDEDVPDGMVTRRHSSLGESHRIQRILMLNPDRVDPEEFLEALVAELFNRYLWMHPQPGRSQSTAPAAPEWFTAGLAQDLYPALRERNHALLRRYMRRDEMPPPALALADDPNMAPRPVVRALRGALLGWLRSQPRFPDRILGWTRDWAAGETLLPADLWTGTPGRDADWDVEWRLWLASQSSVLRAWGQPDLLDIQEIHDRLRIPAAALPGAASAPGPWVTPEVVLQYREERWARQAAHMMRIGLSRYGSGARGETFHQVLIGYTELLMELESPPRLQWGRGPTTTENLSQRLRQARAALDALEQEIQDQKIRAHAPGRFGYLGRPTPEEPPDTLMEEPVEVLPAPGIPHDDKKGINESSTPRGKRNSPMEHPDATSEG